MNKLEFLNLITKDKYFDQVKENFLFLFFIFFEFIYYEVPIIIMILDNFLFKVLTFYYQ